MKRERGLGDERERILGDGGYTDLKWWRENQVRRQHEN